MGLSILFAVRQLGEKMPLLIIGKSRQQGHYKQEF
jgi:hypothetical protein